MHKGIAICIFCFLFQLVASAQVNTLGVITDETTTYAVVRDSLQAIDRVNAEVQSLRRNHYLAADIERLAKQGDTLFAQIHIGERYDTIVLVNHNFGRGYLKDSTQVILKAGQFYELTETILKNYENAGYPFASISLKDVDIHQGVIYCDAFLESYIQIGYDSLEVYGTSKLSKRYLERYLDIREGEVYRESVVRDIDNKLRNLPLVRVNSATRVVFYQGKARIVLDIDEVVTDRVDGVVGFAPNSNNKENNQLLLTGEVNIELNNLFKSGKQFELHWRNYLERSQRLGVEITYPYLFNTKLGINGALDINKYDTIFVNVNSKISFRYQRSGNNYLQFYYQNLSSNLLSVDTSLIRITKTIPSNNSYNIDNYGITWHQRRYDLLVNPRKGHELTIDGAIGRKTILRNTEVDQVLFVNTETGKLISVYDTLNKVSMRAQFDVNVITYIPLFKQSTLRQQVHFSGLFADRILFNELYNFGGFSTLRGFDENELFASKALVYTAEYRYLLDRNSNVGLFVNMAWMENVIESDKLIYNAPLGFGVSANLQVGNGILSMAYALGKQLDNPLELSRGKFHFGIVNYF